ncbi:MAG: glucohydrolase, partial [Lachnospiraceae bacterium]|nr:glucohydrolase [Lachnospiraceae bacterium]
CSIGNMLQEERTVGEFLGEMRDRTFKKYDAFSVGEVFNEKPDEIPDFIGDNGYFSSMFDFNETIFGGSQKGWYDATPITPDDYKNCCFDSQAKVGDIGFLSNIIENHDEPRGVSRYIPKGDCCDESKKMLAALNFMLRGIPFIYQGQELGMENLPISSIDEVDDISTHDEYRVALAAGLSPAEAIKAVSAYSRDNARSPMQWSAEPNAGFTAGTPWLKVNPNYTAINAAAQTPNKDSVFSFYKKLIALRKDPAYQETIVYGALEPLWRDRHNLMAYYRKGEPTLLIVGNYQRDEQEIVLPAAYKKVLLNNYKDIAENQERITLHGYQVLILEM